MFIGPEELVLYIHQLYNNSTSKKKRRRSSVSAVLNQLNQSGFGLQFSQLHLQSIQMLNIIRIRMIVVVIVLHF